MTIRGKDKNTRHSDMFTVPIKEPVDRIWSESNVIVDLVLLHKLFDFASVLVRFLNGQANNSQTLLLVLLCQLNQVRDLTPAGGAPGSPEIDHDWLLGTEELCKLDLLPIERSDIKVLFAYCGQIHCTLGTNLVLGNSGWL